MPGLIQQDGTLTKLVFIPCKDASCREEDTSIGRYTVMFNPNNIAVKLQVDRDERVDADFGPAVAAAAPEDGPVQRLLLPKRAQDRELWRGTSCLLKTARVRSSKTFEQMFGAE